MTQAVASAGSRNGLLLVCLAAVLWGTGNPVAASIYEIASTNAATIAFFRLALSVPLLLVAGWFLLRKRLFHLQRRDLFWVMLTGGLVSLYQVSFYASLPRVGVAIATAIALATAPIVAAVFTAITTRRWPTPKTWLAVALALAATLLIANISADARRPDVIGGALLAFLSGLFYAFNTHMGRQLGTSGRVHPVQTAAFGFTFGACVMLAYGLTTGITLNFPLGGWLRLGYLAVFTTALGYALLYLGMRNTSATAASVATLIEPVTSTLIAVFAFGETLSTTTLLGIVLLLVAMLVLFLDRSN